MNYIRLIEIMHSQELAMVKLALSETGIRYRTFFENTLSIADVYALGNSGVIIEVLEEDYIRAKEVLFEIGIELDYDAQEDRFEIVNKIENITASIPIVGRLVLGYRVLLVMVIPVIIIGLIFILNSLRIVKSDLAGNIWCVEEIVHKGVQLQPNTTSGAVVLGLNEKCIEDIYFRKSGMISLPGFDSYGVRGNWGFKTKAIIVISEAGEFKEIYEGEYAIKTNWSGTMELVSKNTTIVISRKY